MTPTMDPRQPLRAQIAKFMKVMIFVCWGLMAAGFVSVATAGHMSPPSLVAFAAALICLAGVFFILFQSMTKWAADSNYALAGKGLALLFALVGAGILLIFLFV